jgi:hypothetical protein
MSDIRNITLAFPCQEKLERNAAGEFYCHQCAHAITDFRCQSAEALQQAMRQAGTKPVCGIFKRSQLSEKFAKYAAAAAIAITGASATMCSLDAIPKDALENETATPNPDDLSTETVEFITTTGIIVLPPMNTLYDRAAAEKEVMRVLSQHPNGLNVSAKVTLEITLDEQGRITDVYTSSDVPDAIKQEAYRAVSAANYAFQPLMIEGEAVWSRVELTLIFRPFKIAE